MDVRNPRTIGPEAMAVDAMKKMEAPPSPVQFLPVINDESILIGIVTLHGLVSAGLWIVVSLSLYIGYIIALFFVVFTPISIWVPPNFQVGFTCSCVLIVSSSQRIGFRSILFMRSIFHQCSSEVLTSLREFIYAAYYSVI